MGRQEPVLMRLLSVSNMSGKKTKKEMLVPVSQSVYLYGRMIQPEKVLVDVGTGYFIEQSPEQARDYCERRCQFVDKRIAEVAPVIDSKTKTLQTVVQMFQMKQMEAAQAAQAAQEGQAK